MKRFLALIILLAALAACTQQPAVVENQTPEQAPVVPEEAPVPETPPAQAAPAETESEIAERLAREQAEKIAETITHPPKFEPRNRSTVAQQMWNTVSQLDSYQFKTQQGTFFVRGSAVRYLPRNPVVKHNFVRNNVTFQEIYADEIIFDHAAKTATGYCTATLDNVKAKCEELRLYDIDFNLPYDEVAVKLPEDWVKDYLDAETVGEEYEKYYIKSIETTRVRFQDGTEIYFYPRAGLPLKVVKGPLESYTYDDMVINQARPEDVIHRAKKDIPQTEYFYKTPY